MSVSFRSILGTLFIALFVSMLLRKRRTEPQSERPKGKNIVSHITVPTQDLAASLQFFLILGFIKTSSNDAGVLLSLPSCGRYQPMVLLTKSKTKVSTSTFNNGITSLALMVNNVETMMKLMKKNSYEPLHKVAIKEDRTDPEFRPIFEVSRVGFVDNASGLKIELVEYHTLSIKVFFMTLQGLGLMQYPMLQQVTIVSAAPFVTNMEAYKKLDFDTNQDFGEPSNVEKTNNFHGPVYSFPTSSIKKECMFKTWADMFSLNLIEREAPKTVIPSMVRISLKRTHGKVPAGWKTASHKKVETIEFPAPLGKAKVQTMVDPNGVSVELLEYL